MHYNMTRRGFVPQTHPVMLFGGKQSELFPALNDPIKQVIKVFVAPDMQLTNIVQYAYSIFEAANLSCHFLAFHGLQPMATLGFIGK